MRNWLIETRKATKLTQQKVANEVGISRTFYTGIESGQRRPSPEVAQDIADVLDFDWTLFFPRKKAG